MFQSVYQKILNSKEFNSFVKGSDAEFVKEEIRLMSDNFISKTFVSLIVSNFLKNRGLKELFIEKKFIEGRNQIVYLKLDNASEPVFVAKKTNSETIVKEYYIGQIINTLQCPCFVFTFNLYSLQTKYLITEYVKGKTLHQYISSEEFNIDELFTILSILFLSLHIAYSRIGLVHNDFHTNNIILKEIDKPIYIYFNNKKYTFQCRYLPVIIDFGLSHVNNYEAPRSEEPFEFLVGPSKNYEEKVGIYKSCRYIGYDCYKLILNIVGSLFTLESNKESYKKFINRIMKMLPYLPTITIPDRGVKTSDMLIEKNYKKIYKEILKSVKGYHALNDFNDPKFLYRMYTYYDYFNLFNPSQFQPQDRIKIIMTPEIFYIELSKIFREKNIEVPKLEFSEPNFNVQKEYYIKKYLYLKNEITKLHNKLYLTPTDNVSVENKMIEYSDKYLCSFNRKVDATQTIFRLFNIKLFHEKIIIYNNKTIVLIDSFDRYPTILKNGGVTIIDESSGEGFPFDSECYISSSSECPQSPLKVANAEGPTVRAYDPTLPRPLGALSYPTGRGLQRSKDCIPTVRAYDPTLPLRGECPQRGLQRSKDCIDMIDSYYERRDKSFKTYISRMKEINNLNNYPLLYFIIIEILSLESNPFIFIKFNNKNEQILFYQFIEQLLH